MIIEETPRPICTRCNKNNCAKNGISKNGFIKYKKYCSFCSKIIYNSKNGNRKIGYKKHKKESCEQCGFIPVHMCQLDVDHIDGDRTNNDLSNLQTLCSNCHRLKTKGL